MIFYTNGFETWIWDDASRWTPRKLYGFYSKDSLQYLIRQRSQRQELTKIIPDKEIAGRLYQIRAVTEVLERFQNRRRKTLIVQATGTGKTRVAISLSEALSAPAGQNTSCSFPTAANSVSRPTTPSRRSCPTNPASTSRPRRTRSASTASTWPPIRP